MKNKKQKNKTPENSIENKQAELPENVFEGNNYRLTFTDEGLIVEVSGEDNIHDEGIYGELSHTQRLVPYKQTYIQLVPYRKTRTVDPYVFAFLILETGNDEFDGKVEIDYTAKLMDLVDKYHVAVNGLALLLLPTDVEEKPKKVIKTYKHSALTTTLLIVLPILLMTVSALAAVSDRKWLPFMIVSFVCGGCLIIYACIMLVLPQKLLFYTHYVQLIRSVPISYFPLTCVQKMTKVTVGKYRKYLLVINHAEVLQLHYSDEVYEAFQERLASVECLDLHYD